MKRTIESREEDSLNEEQACRWLSSNGFDRHNLKKRKGKWKSTAMTFAAYSGNLELCKFIYHHSDPSVLRMFERDGQSPMHKACRQGHLFIAKWLYTMGAEYDLDMNDIEGSTPLHLACNGGHLPVVKWIFEIRPSLNINIRNGWNESLISLAAQSTNVELCGYLALKNAFNGNDGHVETNLVQASSLNIKWSLYRWCDYHLAEYSNFKKLFLVGTLSHKHSPTLALLTGLSNCVVKLITEYSGLVYGRGLRNIRELKSCIEEMDSNSTKIFDMLSTTSLTSDSDPDSDSDNRGDEKGI